MSGSWRIGLVSSALSVLLFAGCEKSGSSSGTPAKGTGSTSAPSPNNDLYSKKLPGVWEGTEDVGGGKSENVTVEFKPDGGFSVVMGPFAMKGTWKLVKEEGKKLTIDTEVTFEGLGNPKEPAKPDKKTLLVAFEDADTIVMSKVGDKPDPRKLKRKK